MSSKTFQRLPWLARWCPNAEWVLLVVIALEIAIFSLSADSFLTVENAFEITRLAAEVGLLAFGLTFVIKTGGIDLSVGSMMGLCAVVLGATWSNWNLPIWLAAGLTLVFGGLGGALNGWIITRLRVPPLIVTLATFSLFRGLAEAFTGGYVSYTGFPAHFVALGQGYVFGGVPVQLLVGGVVFLLLWIALHRTVFGRELTALGFKPDGARFAGIRVERVVTTAYIVSGVTAALAGIIYVSRIAQAKADAGLGYELSAIAAVVLGGTSIAGGRGTLHGTILGLFCLIILQNGLRLSGQPSEIAGIFTGVVLIAAIALNQFWSRQRTVAKPVTSSPTDLDMKNSQVALIIAAILAGALVIAASNVFLARSLAGGAQARSQSSPPAPTAQKIVVAMTPKAKADPYFVSCKQGADEAAEKLGVEILWDAPTDPDPAKQNEIVEAWITKGVDVIAASAASPDAISNVLRKAQQRGIKVITWDADAKTDSRSFFVNQATAQGIGATLADEGARLADGAGKYAIITASLTDANQNEWIKYIKERMASTHPKMELAAIHPCDGQRDKAMAEAKNITRAYPDIKVILAICSPAVPGAAEALKQENRTNVRLTGLSTPNLNRDYVHQGWVDSIVLWNTKNLGYLTVTAARAIHDGKLAPGATSLDSGRLGSLAVEGDQILLGKPFVFTKANIDQFRF